MPGEDWEKTPTLGQALRTGGPHLIKGQIPAATDGDAMANILITRGAEPTRIVTGHGAVPLPESGSVIDAVGKGIGNCEVRPADPRSGHLLGKTNLQAIVAGVGDIPEFREIGKTTGCIGICIRTRVSKIVNASGVSRR